MKHSIAWLLVALGAHCLITNVPATSMEGGVERAILSQDWRAVVQLLSPRTNETTSCVAELVRAHAEIALNQNNTSLKLFLKIRSKRELQDYDLWASQFARLHDENGLAHYFLGDSMARLGKMDAALLEFTKALELGPRIALIPHARGWIYLAKGDSNRALIDFCNSIKINDSFAEAHNSLGSYWICTKASPQQAVRSFDSALKLSPDSALSMNGLACADFALGAFERMLGNLNLAKTKATWLTLPDANLATFLLIKERLFLPIKTGGEQVKAGTSIEAIDRYIETLPANEARNVMKRADVNVQTSEALGKAVKQLENNAVLSGHGDGERIPDRILDLRDRLNACRSGKASCTEEEIRILEEELTKAYEDWRGYPPAPKNSSGASQFIILYGPDGKPIAEIGSPWIRMPIPTKPKNDLPFEFRLMDVVRELANDKSFWSGVRDAVPRLRPEVITTRAKGISAQDVIGGFFDKGVTLATGCGLGYRF